MTGRELAAKVRVSPAHLSRTVRGSKKASPDLMRRVALALAQPEDYFTEVRLGSVIEHLESDPKLVDRLYKELTASRDETSSAPPSLVA
jgi:transcriptional regulator with XRE-family HTH domain